MCWWCAWPLAGINETNIDEVSASADNGTPGHGTRNEANEDAYEAMSTVDSLFASDAADVDVDVDVDGCQRMNTASTSTPQGLPVGALQLSKVLQRCSFAEFVWPFTL